MKKLIALLLVAVMCLPLMACNNESGDTETPSSGENTKPNSDNNQSESEKELQKNGKSNKETTKNTFIFLQLLK